MSESLRILALAYACEPGEGSEPGAGWAWARMLTSFGKVWVITRANNREAIENALPHLPQQERVRLRFVYVDLPPWARFWKRGQRGVRLYYLLWQLAALRATRAIRQREEFDLVWHVTLSTAWLGSVGPLVGRPFVYGPVGGGVRVPARLTAILGFRGALFELVRSCSRAVGRYANPLTRVAWRNATLILTQNRETLRWLPRRHRHKATVFPNVVLEDASAPSRNGRGDPPTALFAGRLIAWKGAGLAVRAMTYLPDWHLIVCGTGRDEMRLRRLTHRLGLDHRVHFVGWVERAELLAMMKEKVDVFLHPSLREEAGWVVPEALQQGLPVVCLDRGGPPLLGGNAVPVSGPTETSRALAARLTESLNSPAIAPSFSALDRTRLVRAELERRGLMTETITQEVGSA